MKKSELRKIIRSIIKEQGPLPQPPNKGADILFNRPQSRSGGNGPGKLTPKKDINVSGTLPELIPGCVDQTAKN